MRVLDLVGVRVELPANTPMVLLRERDGDGRLLPIYIGNPEAASIHAALEGVVPPRPMTHDLMVTLIDDLGATLERVVITEVRDHTFYAELRLSTPDGVEHRLSSRPSDACALAVRTGVTIFAADNVLDAAGKPPEEPGEDTEEILDEFQSFLENVNPEDFQA
jgi:bifunctional DNase/RNase